MESLNAFMASIAVLMIHEYLALSYINTAGHTPFLKAATILC